MREKFMRICQNGPLDNFMRFLFVFYRFMPRYIWRDKNLCGTNSCDQRLTRMIRINKSHTEICRFTVQYSISNHELSQNHRKNVPTNNQCHLQVSNNTCRWQGILRLVKYRVLRVLRFGGIYCDRGVSCLCVKMGICKVKDFHNTVGVNFRQ